MIRVYRGKLKWTCHKEQRVMTLVSSVKVVVIYGNTLFMHPSKRGSVKGQDGGAWLCWASVKWSESLCTWKISLSSIHQWGKASIHHPSTIRLSACTSIQLLFRYRKKTPIERNIATQWSIQPIWTPPPTQHVSLSILVKKKMVTPVVKHKIVKKRTAPFKRHQSDRFARVGVSKKWIYHMIQIAYSMSFLL